MIQAPSPANLQPANVAYFLQLVLNRYASMCDTRDWNLFDQVFANPANAEYGGHAIPHRNAILHMLRHHLDGCGPTQHLLGFPEIEFEDTELRSRTAVRAAHRGAGRMTQLSYECLGNYEDSWTLTSDGWRIVHRRMVITLEFGDRTILRPTPS